MTNLQLKLIEEMKEIQECLLEFLDNDDNSEDDFSNLKIVFNNYNIVSDQHKFKALLYLILNISNNHHRNPNFFIKIDKIFRNYKTEIKRFFSDSEIFKIFKSSKRILFFLINEQIISIDENIIKTILSGKYVERQFHEFFAPEIKSFINQISIEKYNNIQSTDNAIEAVSEVYDQMADDFNDKRKIGENDETICSYIRNDSIEDFVRYINQTSYSLKNTINRSMFETNSFLLTKNKMTLIEYVTFCGAIQIFQYLKINNIELTPSLWFYAIHGNNPEIIHILEEYHIKLEDESYKQYIKESIKCHHNDIANYFITNFLETKKGNPQFILSHCIKYYNFDLIQDDLIDLSSIYEFCKYDYYSLVEILFKNKKLDINKIIILLIFY